MCRNSKSAKFYNFWYSEYFHFNKTVFILQRIFPFQSKESVTLPANMEDFS